MIPLATSGHGMMFNGMLLVFTSLILTFMVLSGHLNPFVGFALLAIKVLILAQSFWGCGNPQENVEPEAMGPAKASLMTLGGAVLVGGSGYALVESATKLAMIWGVPSALIGLSVIAVGTSLPELAATIAAARQRRGDLILGNIIGSNLANILIVLGFTSLACTRTSASFWRFLAYTRLFYDFNVDSDWVCHHEKILEPLDRCCFPGHLFCLYSQFFLPC